MISFLLSYLSLYSNVSAAEPVVQNLEYALSVADQQIGTRTVKTTYFIDENNKQASRRIIEVYTEISGSVFGKDLVFKERSSIEYDGRDINLVSTQSLNDDPIESKVETNVMDLGWCTKYPMGFSSKRHIQVVILLHNTFDVRQQEIAANARFGKHGDIYHRKRRGLVWWLDRKRK